MPQIDKYLDNPAWYALTGPHAALAVGDSYARRYPSDVSPFAAVAENTERAFAALARLVEPRQTVVLADSCPEPSDIWRLTRQLSVVQMVCERPPAAPAEQEPAIILLTQADVPAMLRLTELTRPGPFLPRTIELGTYVAIQQDAQIAAMAGVRFHPPGCREISAVCTHPSFRRRGYGKRLVSALIDEIRGADEIPFLHVMSENGEAIALYEALGFVRRAELNLFVLERR